MRKFIISALSFLVSVSVFAETYVFTKPLVGAYLSAEVNANTNVSETYVGSYVYQGNLYLTMSGPVTGASFNALNATVTNHNPYWKPQTYLDLEIACSNVIYDCQVEAGSTNIVHAPYPEGYILMVIETLNSLLKLTNSASDEVWEGNARKASELKAKSDIIIHEKTIEAFHNQFFGAQIPWSP